MFHENQKGAFAIYRLFVQQKHSSGSQQNIFKSDYTQEKICNLNDHCNDDCKSSLEWSNLTHERKFVNWMIIVMMIAIYLQNANSWEEERFRKTHVRTIWICDCD